MGRMRTSANKFGPERDGASAVCEPVCESEPNSAAELPQPSAERAPSGRFQPGNSVGARTQFQKDNTRALRHGGRSRRAAAALLPGQQAIRAALIEKRSAIVADLGGGDSLTTIAADEV